MMVSWHSGFGRATWKHSRKRRLGVSLSVHGPRQLRDPRKMTQAPNESGSKADDPFQSIKQMAAEIIQPRRNRKAYKESKAVKSFRRQAMEGGPGRDAKLCPGLSASRVSQVYRPPEMLSSTLTVSTLRMAGIGPEKFRTLLFHMGTYGNAWTTSNHRPLLRVGLFKFEDKCPPASVCRSG